MTATANEIARETERVVRLERFLEYVADWRTSEVRVDRQAGMIENIVLAGPNSRNGYRYKTKALRDAVDLYDGKIVFLDHAADPSRPRQRSTRDVAGTLVRPRFVGGKLRGDISTVDTEAGQTLLALAESDRPGVGMSHVVLARRNEDGSVVEKIHEVVSVDAVVFPATATSFHEQQGDRAPSASDSETPAQAASVSAASPEVDQQASPQPSAAEEDRSDEERPETATLADRLQQLADGLEHLLEQIVTLVGNRDPLRNKAARPSSDDRSRARRARVEQIVEEYRLPRDSASDVFLDLLAACDDETQVRALIEDRRRLLESNRHRVPTSRERTENGTATTDPSAALIAAITGRSVTSSAKLLDARV